MWHKFSNIETDTFDDYPPEGITVKVTDGRTIDEAYLFILVLIVGLRLITI